MNFNVLITELAELREPIIGLWIAYLKDPLILIAFSLFILSGIIKHLKTDNLSPEATKSLFDKGLNYTFYLGLLIIIAGFLIKFTQTYINKPFDNHAIFILISFLVLIVLMIFIFKIPSKKTTPKHNIKQSISDSSGTVYQSASNINLTENPQPESIENNTDTASIDQNIKNTRGIVIQSGKNIYSKHPNSQE